MKRLILVLAVFFGFASSMALPVQAAVTWPATCSTFKCVNAHMNALHSTQVAQRKTISSLSTKLSSTRTLLLSFLGCMSEAAVTEYSDFFVDDGAGGSTLGTGLDFSAGSGVQPDTWVMFDSCNTGVARPVASAAIPALRLPRVALGDPLGHR
jgi:hypothetical protein